MEVYGLIFGILAILIIVGLTVLIYKSLDKNHQHLLSVSKHISDLSTHLANPKTRGMWGERIALDVIKLIGLQEGIHYSVQETNAEGKRPDFTFHLLPSSTVCNMDSKFPLTNYLGFVQSTNPVEMADFKERFLKDVKARIREVGRKSYIDPQAGTTDFAIVFIPNEQILNFVIENDPTFIDFCLSLKVVVCSPWSLYSTLSMLYQASDAFALAKAEHKVVAEIRQFQKEWINLKDELSKLHKSLESTVSQSETVVGVRSRQLDRSLNKFKGGD